MLHEKNKELSKKKKMGLGEKGKIPDDDEATCRTRKLDHKHKQGCGRLGPVPSRNRAIQ